MMALPVNWYDDAHSIIVSTITSTTTWDEYHQAVDWIVTEAAKVDHRVDIIFHDDIGMPKGNPMPHLKQGSVKIIAQENIYLSIIAGSGGYSGFGRMILAALGKSMIKMRDIVPVLGSEKTLLFLPTLDEALAHIKKVRLTSTLS
jgi:hypothetical protein